MSNLIEDESDHLLHDEFDGYSTAYTMRGFVVYYCLLAWYKLVNEVKYQAHKHERRLMTMYGVLQKAKHVNNQKIHQARLQLNGIRTLRANTRHVLLATIRDHQLQHAHWAAQCGDTFSFTQSDVQGWLATSSMDLLDQMQQLIVRDEQKTAQLKRYRAIGSELTESCTKCIVMRDSIMMAEHLNQLSSVLQCMGENVMDNLAKKCSDSLDMYFDVMENIKDDTTQETELMSDDVLWTNQSQASTRMFEDLFKSATLATPAPTTTMTSTMPNPSSEQEQHQHTLELV